MRNWITLVFLLFSLVSFANEPDSLGVGEFRLMYKNEPVPYDSAVVVSYRQYVYTERQRKLSSAQSVIKVALERPSVVQIKYVDRIVEKKPHWLRTAGVIVTSVAIGLTVGLSVK